MLPPLLLLLVVVVLLLMLLLLLLQLLHISKQADSELGANKISVGNLAQVSCWLIPAFWLVQLCLQRELEAKIKSTRPNL